MLNIAQCYKILRLQIITVLFELCGIRRYKIIPLLSRSKTACRGFKSFCPCQRKHRIFGAFFLYLRLFTAILLTFLIQIKLRRTFFSVRRLFIFTPFFVHFVPHNPPNSFGTSSKKHQSQFKSVSNDHQHIRVSFYIIHFGYLRSCVSK